MRIPKTPKEFDYDLWTTEDGKNMVRVKRTGEMTEVDHEVMKILRIEEKRLRRSYGEKTDGDEENAEGKPSNSILSLEALPDEVKIGAWLADPYDFTEEFLLRLEVDAFKKLLTEKQQDVFQSCMINGETYVAYARRKGIREQSVQETARYIKKKAENFFKKI